MSESLTTKQVAEHNTVETGLYIIIDGDVYKMDEFVEEHPGGSKILKRVGGKDASKQFWKVCFYVSLFFFLSGGGEGEREREGRRSGGVDAFGFWRERGKLTGR